MFNISFRSVDRSIQSNGLSPWLCSSADAFPTPGFSPVPPDIRPEASFPQFRNPAPESALESGFIDGRVPSDLHAMFPLAYPLHFYQSSLNQHLKLSQSAKQIGSVRFKIEFLSIQVCPRTPGNPPKCRFPAVPKIRDIFGLHWGQKSETAPPT